MRRAKYGPTGLSRRGGSESEMLRCWGGREETPVEKGAYLLLGEGGSLLMSRQCAPLFPLNSASRYCLAVSNEESVLWKLTASLKLNKIPCWCLVQDQVEVS